MSIVVYTSYEDTQTHYNFYFKITDPESISIQGQVLSFDIYWPYSLSTLQNQIWYIQPNGVGFINYEDLGSNLVRIKLYFGPECLLNFYDHNLNRHFLEVSIGLWHETFEMLDKSQSPAIWDENEEIIPPNTLQVFPNIIMGDTSPLVDVDGNPYTTFNVGPYEFIVENFRPSRMGDGTEIPLVGEPDSGGFIDNHESGNLDGWDTVGDRNWIESEGYALPQSDQALSGFLINQFDCKNDGSFEVVYTWANDNPHNMRFGGIVFRFTDSNNYYALGIRIGWPDGVAPDNQIRFFKNQMWSDMGGELIVDNLDFSGITNFKLRVDLNGSIISIYLNDSLMGSVNDSDHASGKVGYFYLAENEVYTRFNSAEWTQDSSSEIWDELSYPARCLYDNDPENFENLGYLYNWFTVEHPEFAKLFRNGVEDPGWKIFTRDEMDEFRQYLIFNGFNWDNTFSGNKVAKSLASSDGEWSASATAGHVGNDQSSNNSTGFTALPGGYRSHGTGGQFHGKGTHAIFWTSIENNDDEAFVLALHHNSPLAIIGILNKKVGSSIRLFRKHESLQKRRIIVM